MNGYADEPEGIAANVRLCVGTGVAGLSIEDNTGRTDAPLYEKKLAIDRIRAARSAIEASGDGVVLTGRCEAWLVNHPEPFRTVLDRLAAYAEAGADCLYAPGVSKPDEITQIVKAVAPKPVNVLVSGFNHQLSLSQLTDLGVRRISVGSGLALAAWGAFSARPKTLKQTVLSIFWLMAQVCRFKRIVSGKNLIGAAFEPRSQLRYWNFRRITSSCSDEILNHYRPDPSRTSSFLFVSVISAFPSDAAAAARCDW